MKKLHQIILFVSIISIISCSKEPDNTPKTLVAAGTVDFNAIANVVGNDITAFVTFNGQPANTYTTEAIPGDNISYTFNSSATTEMFLEDIDFQQGTQVTIEDEQFKNNIREIADPRDKLFFSGIEILQGVPTNYERKFDLFVRIKVNGVLDQRVFKIDPKIKIRASR
jgi:hypothetical protein